MQTSDSQQVNIFSDDLRQLHFAELCNALYERELHSISQKKFNNISLLQRQIGGLKHHIKRAAYNMLQHQSPLEIDIHNASWQAKQAANCPAKLSEIDKTYLWFQSQTALGVCTAVYVNELGLEHIELDTIDRIDTGKIHLNKFGWFTLDGLPVIQQSESQQTTSQAPKIQLLKPTKNLMLAASCGHSWNHKGRSQPRLLSLRELLLSFSINWKTFR
ncbi:hypothetical protein [Paraglaciecola hydrolytica]|uniref:Uncharacterized protein n=1 Tax=Paraglaciecola hydrolytica TaxID=1799789 RepID=A0A135ZYR0_9ALTE|nr:hypothetical protein [Paraglaciecola hydrolytica]KXI28115.1 hypothetical protein AX660_17165 [Paraglaciecola hydrolytica]